MLRRYFWQTGAHEDFPAKILTENAPRCGETTIFNFNFVSTSEDAPHCSERAMEKSYLK